MKNVQISQDLFFNLIRYHLAEMCEFEDDIKTELEKKINSMVKRQYYSEYKTAETDEEKEIARQKYLDE